MPSSEVNSFCIYISLVQTIKTFPETLIIKYADLNFRGLLNLLNKEPLFILDKKFVALGFHYV